MILFEQLKRNKLPLADAPVKDNGPLFFQLLFDDGGAYLETVNTEGNPVESDYRRFSGALRQVAKNIQLLREKSQFTIDWENAENRLYMHEHPHLIAPLLESGHFINQDGDPITPRKGKGSLRVSLLGGKDQSLDARVRLFVEGEALDTFRFIQEEYAWLPGTNQIVATQAAGPLFAELSLFNVNGLPIRDLQKYLSLLFSYVDHAPLDYGNYTVKKETEPLKARPALIFEKVDMDNALYIRIGQIMPDMEVNFLDDYDLYRFAVINEMEEVIYVHPLEQVHLEEHVDLVEKMLHKRSGYGRKKAVSPVIRQDSLLIVPQEVASAFIQQDIARLISDYALIGSEKLKEYKVNVHPPRLDVQLGHGIDFLEGTASLHFGDQQISLLDALRQFNKNRYVMLADGSHALVNEQYIKKLQRLFRKKNGKVQVSFFDLPVLEELLEERTGSRQFTQAKKIFEGFNTLTAKKARLPQVGATLRPYQKQGFLWLRYLHDNKLGGCLADDMGLGKTLQAIVLLKDVYGKEKKAPASLIVMPRSLLFNWEKELDRFAPDLSYYTWYGQNRDIRAARKGQLILTTYGMLRSDIEIWKEEKFLYAILDESQAIKNLNSQTHKGALLLDAAHRLALSGTPVENNLSELYALFRFLNPAMFGSADTFNENYLKAIQKHNDKGATAELRKKIYPFILRRLKKEVLRELPDKIEQTLYVEMSEAQARYYEQRRQFYQEAIRQQVAAKGMQQARFFIFQALNELRQIASIPESQTEGRIRSPKIEMVTEQLGEAIANRHKVLVFANFLAAVEQIGEELDKREIGFVTMTGSVRNRQELVEQFQTDPDCKAFILTLKTGGTGLNLTAADMAFIFDPWWNKAAENQAIDRAHRIGQDKTVMSYKFITLGTIEEKILLLQQQKSALFENIISTDDASLKSLTEEDIHFMLGK